MVKITNPLGDVKIGRQGEVVYQRKYGEQIRRTASPKRAISSQAQIKHRDLYRAALAWRSQLSLANRRYLEGYPIASGLVDRYGIPLPWSRFALKLYLEKVRFAVIEKALLVSADYEGENQAYDNEPDFDTQRPVFLNTWCAQTFTPSEDLELTKIQVFVRKYGTPSQGYVRLRATDGSGHPTLPDLASVEIVYGSLPGTFTWMEYALTYPNLAKGVLYALIVSMVAGNSSNRLDWKADMTSPTYPGGIWEHSTNAGASWTSYDIYDLAFRIFGKWKVETSSPGLIHVRHPALLKVVHKRGGLSINGYDTLSSLDEEYLTGQVGLDVAVGDEILATSLPGIEYKHQVL